MQRDQRTGSLITMAHSYTHEHMMLSEASKVDDSLKIFSVFVPIWLQLFEKMRQFGVG